MYSITSTTDIFEGIGINRSSSMDKPITVITSITNHSLSFIALALLDCLLPLNFLGV
jgi:hypothetical protein